MLRCDCCGREWNTTAAFCTTCTTWTLCSCGQRFCSAHQQEALEKHSKTCPGWAPILGSK